MGRLFRDSRVQEAIRGPGWLDQEPVKVHAVEEMEESAQVPADSDQLRLQTPGSSQGLDQNEQMAVGSPQGGPLCHEPQVVQKAGPYFLE